METICLQCGDKGCTDALVSCGHCLSVGVHRYCLDEIPKPPNAYVCWYCEDCDLEVKTQLLFHKMDAQHLQMVTATSDRRFYQSSAQTNIKDAQRSTLQPEEGTSRMDEQRRATMLSDKKEGQRRPKLPNAKSGSYHSPPLSTKRDHSHLSRKSSESDSGPGRAKCHSLSSNASSKSLLKKRTSTTSEANLDSRREGTLSVDHSRAYKQPRSENQCSNAGAAGRSIDRGNNLIDNGESNLTVERSAGSNHTSNSCQKSPKDLNILSTIDCSLPSAPIRLPVWRGSFNIWNKKDDLTELVVAHISSGACEKVYNEACQFTPVLHLEILHKSEIWPKSFGTSEISGENIALYFFPSHIRSERVFDQLVDEMQQNDLALRAILPNAELLVFTSTELQLPYWRFHKKYYLWGVFRAKQDGPVVDANLGKAAMVMKSNGVGSSLSAYSRGSTT